MATRKRALVLGGGGIAGIGWETGLLFGLAERDIDVTAPDLVVGTSAGSVVGAQLLSGTPLGTLHDRHVLPEGESTEIAAEFDADALMKAWGAMLEKHAPGQEMRAAIGSYALAAPTVPERARREVISARLTSHDWPAADLRIVAADAATGEVRVFTAADGVELVDAVAASCAVPGIWPPVTVDGRRYVDGGIRTSLNIDLAEGYDVVLALAPVSDFGQPEAEIAAATKKMLKRKKVLVISPDEESLAAIGTNPLDPATARPAAMAGRSQAERIADEVRAVWTA
ncbi:MAG: patatin-like phospholipase family protein [Frankiales bacterium]|nr:patatin-like phospholipase family protein [Frankiales bacterium]